MTLTPEQEKEIKLQLLQTLIEQMDHTTAGKMKPCDPAEEMSEGEMPEVHAEVVTGKPADELKKKLDKVFKK